MEALGLALCRQLGLRSWEVSNKQALTTKTDESDLCTTELFYEKDYSKAMAAYTLSLCLGSQLGSLIGGQLIAARGWQWHFKLLAILGGVNFFTLLFFCPETAYIQDIADNANAADVDDDIRRNTDGKKQSAMKSLTQNLFYLRHPHVRGGGLRQWVLSFLLQIEYTFNPTVLLSSGMWGISLAW